MNPLTAQGTRSREKPGEGKKLVLEKRCHRLMAQYSLVRLKKPTENPPRNSKGVLERVTNTG